MGHCENLRVELQTNEEWLSELKSGEKVIPAAFSGNQLNQTAEPKLVFDSHRTTKTGSVILSFLDQKDSREIVAFFNICLIRKRGKYKGQKYRTGVGGQFLPLPRSKFRRFWELSVGKPPRRWATVHKQLRPALRDMLFTGKIYTAYRSDGTPFLKVVDLAKLEQFEYN